MEQGGKIANALDFEPVMFSDITEVKLPASVIGIPCVSKSSNCDSIMEPDAATEISFDRTLDSAEKIVSFSNITDFLNSFVNSLVTFP